jgi:hypothetical protein
MNLRLQLLAEEKAELTQKKNKLKQAMCEMQAKQVGKSLNRNTPHSCSNLRQRRAFISSSSSARRDTDKHMTPVFCLGYLQQVSAVNIMQTRNHALEKELEAEKIKSQTLKKKLEVTTLTTLSLQVCSRLYHDILLHFAMMLSPELNPPPLVDQCMTSPRAWHRMSRDSRGG